VKWTILGRESKTEKKTSTRNKKQANVIKRWWICYSDIF